MSFHELQSIKSVKRAIRLWCDVNNNV
jgi:hypothetical protein